jgi:aminopeptidase YwaD
VDIPSRRVGSAGNQAATNLFSDIVSSFGFETKAPEFDCIDWSQDGVELAAGGASFEAFASPYSLGCQVSAPLLVISTMEELEAAEASDKIVLLCGDLAKEQLMPKSFPHPSVRIERYTGTWRSVSIGSSPENLRVSTAA